MALSPPYDGYLKADLEAEAARRKLDVPEGALKSELITRLEKDDRDAAKQSTESPVQESPEPVAPAVSTTRTETVAQVTEPPPSPQGEPVQASAPILRETDERPAPVVTDVEALGAVQQRIEGHQPTPYPSDEDARNRIVNAFTPDLVPAPPAIQDVTNIVGEVNVGEVNVDVENSNVSRRR